ncbi:MAG: DUF484 family protein [Thermochromatium sp.]
MQQAEHNQDDLADQERQVAEYLIAHPDFLVRHPEVLSAIEVPHGIPGAVSLIEYQVRLLRRQLAIERNRLAQLIARARDNETLAIRLHRLFLQLMGVGDLEHLCRLLRETLLREFHAEALAFKLFAHATIGHRPHDPLVSAFADFMDRRKTLCGPLNPEHAQALFGDGGVAIHSAAIIPIQTDGQSGILAIGSAETLRFRPEMSTDFLDRLGEILSQKLRTMRLGHCQLS